MEVVGEKHSTKENSCSSKKEKNLDNEEDTIKKHSEGKKIEKVYKRWEEVEKRFGKEEGLYKDKTKKSDVENIIEHQREVVANEKIEKRVLEVVEDSFCEKEQSFIERSKNDVEVGNDGERKNRIFSKTILIWIFFQMLLMKIYKQRTRNANPLKKWGVKNLMEIKEMRPYWK